MKTNMASPEGAQKVQIVMISTLWKIEKVQTLEISSGDRENREGNEDGSTSSLRTHVWL